MRVFLLIIFVAGVLVGYLLVRRKWAAGKVAAMETEEKITLLNKLAEPFGFVFSPQENIFTATLNAWQREFGYCSLYDETAPHFHIIFDCLPVYFDYGGKTWLIEFWKGQYGINIGGEIGVYASGRILKPQEYKEAMFESITDEQLIPMSIKLSKRGEALFEIERRHWWLTGFCTGRYCEPEELSMKASLTFPDQAMLDSFTHGLLEKGYREEELEVEGLTLSFWLFYFGGCASRHFCRLGCGGRRRGRRRRGCQRRRQGWKWEYRDFVQWMNRFLCCLYNWAVRPFTEIPDQLLLLYFCIPVSIGYVLRPRRNPRQEFWRERL